MNWTRFQLLLACVVCSNLFLQPSAKAQDSESHKIQLLQKELELLKKEVELLKMENELLKKKIALSGGDAANQGKEKPDAVLKGVEYKFVSLKTEGTESTLKIAVTSKDRDQHIPELVAVTLVASDGRTFTGPKPSLERSVTVRKGVTQIVSYPLGTIPAEMTSFKTIILPAGDNPSEARKNPARLTGTFKVE